MTEEEKAAAAKAEADAAQAKLDEEAKAALEADKVTLIEAENAKLREERDNYKEVALKRLGKLPADSEFLGDSGADISSLIEEKVKIALIDKEIARKELEKELEIKRITKENAELRLAIKNRPEGSIGGDSGGSIEVKDNVFTSEQIAVLKKRALSLKADPDKFVENAKKNLLARK